MKPEEIRDLSTENIRQRIEDEQEELDRLHFNHQIAPLENPMVLRNKRREIARLKTILRERELQGEDVQ